MAFPARPTQNQDPWFTTRDAYDAAIEAAVTRIDPNSNNWPEITVDVVGDDTTDNATMIENAITDAATLVNGRRGRKIVLNTTGSVRTSVAHRLPEGVVLAGREMYATTLKPTASFPAGLFFLRLGVVEDAAEHAMGLENLRIYMDARGDIENAVYTTTAQEPAFLERVMILDYRGRAIGTAANVTPAGQSSHLRISNCEFFSSLLAPPAGVDEHILLDTVGNTTLIERSTIVGSRSDPTLRRTTGIRGINAALHIDSCHIEGVVRGTHVTVGAGDQNGKMLVTGMSGHTSVDDLVYITDRAPHSVALASAHGSARTLNNTHTGETYTDTVMGYTNLLRHGIGNRVKARTVTGYAYLSRSDQWVNVNAASAVTIDVPSYAAGKKYMIQSLGAGQVTITPDPTTTKINGATSKRLDAAGSWLEMVFDGTTWHSRQSGTVTDIP